MRARMLLVLSALTVLVPLAGADEGDPLCVIFITAEPDWSVVRMRADLILADDERTNISREVDADGDGNITLAEVDAYHAASIETHTEPSELGDKMLYLDGKPPTRLVTRMQLANWTGPVDTAKNGTVTEHRSYEMSPTPWYEHALSGGLYAHPFVIPRPVIEVVVLQAPARWLVMSVTQEPKPDADRDPENATTTPTSTSRGTQIFTGPARSATIEGFDLERAYVVTYRHEDPSEFTTPPRTPTPAAGLLAVGGALGLAALLARRR